MKKKITRAQRRERDELIRDIANKRPDYTLQELANMFNLNSRSHVYWILHKNKPSKK